MLQTLTKQRKAGIFRGKNEISFASLMSLEMKKKKTKSDWLFLMINCRTECPRNFFKGSNSSSKFFLVYLEALKPRETYG